MADSFPITPDYSSATPIQHLFPRFTAVKAALDALEPLMAPISDRPSPLYNGLQTVFDGLLDEINAVCLVICALDPQDIADLALQADVVRYRYSDHADMRTVDGPLGQLLDHIGGLAA